MPVVVSLRGWPLRDQIASVIAAIIVYGVSHVNAMRARVHIRDSSPLENQTPSHLTPLNTARAVQDVTERFQCIILLAEPKGNLVHYPFPCGRRWRRICTQDTG